MDADVLLPKDAICPISQQVMEDPVVCADGHSYERTCIQEWFARGHRTSPKTNHPLPNMTLIPNISLRNTIEELTLGMPTSQKGEVLLGRVQLRQKLGQRLNTMEDSNMNEHCWDDVGQEPPHCIPGRSCLTGFLSGRGDTALGWETMTINDFRNQQRRGVKPSGAHLNAYARYLGIDPSVDNDLLWIALESLEAPLPAHWSEHYDSLERVFYFNAVTHESRWRHPLEQSYRDAYQTISRFRHGTMSPEERLRQLDELRREARANERSCNEEVAQWTEHVDDDGHRFYFNFHAQQSTWTDPRPAVREILQLRHKALGIAALTASSPLPAQSPLNASLASGCRPQVASRSQSRSRASELMPRVQSTPYVEPCLPARQGYSSPQHSPVKTPQSSPRQSYWDELFSLRREGGSASPESSREDGSASLESSPKRLSQTIVSV